MVGFRPFSLISVGYAVPLRGGWAIFCHAGSNGLAECDQPGENPWKTPYHGRELNPGHKEARQWDSFIKFPLSYHDLTVIIYDKEKHWHLRAREYTGFDERRSEFVRFEVVSASCWTVGPSFSVGRSFYLEIFDNSRIPKRISDEQGMIRSS